MAHESPAEKNPAHSLDDIQNTPLHLVFQAKKNVQLNFSTSVDLHRSGQVLDKVFGMGVGAF